MVSSLSTAVLRCELYWDMRWALGWVSTEGAGRLVDGFSWDTELPLGRPLGFFLVDLVDLP